ncbi:MAG: aldo/keto reductase [Candidatus Dormibacteria bacterium]
MQLRRLGAQGPMVSAVGLGAMSFAGVYGDADDAASAATLARALELGVTFIDTANIYGSGHSEEVAGRAHDFDHNVRLVGHLEAMARRHGISTAQLALAWVLHQGGDIVPIPGTRRRENLEANAAAADVTLTAVDLREIDAVASPDMIAGARGAAQYMSRVDV